MFKFDEWGDYVNNQFVDNKKFWEFVQKQIATQQRAGLIKEETVWHHMMPYRDILICIVNSLGYGSKYPVDYVHKFIKAINTHYEYVSQLLMTNVRRSSSYTIAHVGESIWEWDSHNNDILYIQSSTLSDKEYYIHVA